MCARAREGGARQLFLAAIAAKSSEATFIFVLDKFEQVGKPYSERVRFSHKSSFLISIIFDFRNILVEIA
jgi:hypothetical protein